jgi:hypothetical protein
MEDTNRAVLCAVLISTICKRCKFQPLHMAAPSEELRSTGVAAVNSSDFLLLCLCVAAAISLWKMLVHRNRDNARDEIKPKGSCQTSTLWRSQSPPPPREQPAPSAKSRSAIVFDEWDGRSAPPPSPPPHFLFLHQSQLKMNYFLLRFFICTCITISLHPRPPHAPPPFFLTSLSGIARVAVFDKRYGKFSASLKLCMRVSASHHTGPNRILRSLRIAPDNSSRRLTFIHPSPPKLLPHPPPPHPHPCTRQTPQYRRIIRALRRFRPALYPALQPCLHPSLLPHHRRIHCSHRAPAAVQPSVATHHRHWRRRRLHDPVLCELHAPADRSCGA